MIPERLTQARSFGCETVDLRKDASLAEQIALITGEPLVDSAIDCVGFEARGHGSAASVEQPACDGTEFDYGDHPRRRFPGNSWIVCYRRPGYKDFDRGAAKKFVIDPHGTARKAVA